MKKEQLIAAGLNEEQVANVLKLYKEAIDGNYVIKHRFDEVNGELKTTKEQVASRDAQIAELKKFEGDSKALNEKIAALEKENKEKSEKYMSELAGERKRTAVKLALLEDEATKPFDTDMVVGLFNLDNIDIDESGKVSKGFKEQADTIKKEKAFLFNTKTESGKPAGWKPAGTPPADGDKGGQSSDQFTSFGKSLAQIKLSMMGIQPANTENNK